MDDVLSTLDALASALPPTARGRDLALVRERLGALETLSLLELTALDEQAQEVFHDLLLSTSRGELRDACFRAAYAVVPAVLCERRRRQGQVIDGFGIGTQSVQRVLGFLGKEPKRVVDVGCSSGLLVEALLRAGHDARGVELSRQLVDLGSSRLSGAGFGDDRLVCGDFLRLDDDALGRLSGADLIWSNDVLEHLHPDDVPQFFARCRRFALATILSVGAPRVRQGRRLHEFPHSSLGNTEAARLAHERACPAVRCAQDCC
jgi:SAM-dependent methyltransferase